MNSNETLRFPRTSKEAFGYPIKSWHFQPPTPETGDKVVGIVCAALLIVLPVISYVFDIKLGG